jgi:hypothetical protein
LKELREIDNKVTLRGRIAIPEALKIGVVKGEKFQNLPRSAGKYSRDSRGVAMHRREAEGEWAERNFIVKRMEDSKHY